MQKYNDCIHVEGVYIVKVRFHTRRAYIRAVPVFLQKLCHTHLGVWHHCVHPVSVLLKV